MRTIHWQDCNGKEYWKMCCWEKVPSWEHPCVHRQAPLFSAVYLDEKKKGWAKKLAERQVGKN